MDSKKKFTAGVLGVLITGFLFLNCAAFRPKPIFISENTSQISEKPSSSKKSPPPKPTPKKVPPQKTARGTRTDEVKNKPLLTGDKESVSLRFRQKMMQAIDDYLGTPYKWGGEDSHGMDCSGFVKVIFQQVSGLNLPHSVGKLAREGKPVLLPDLRFGDLIFFRQSGSGRLFHVGIYLGSGNFAHASTQSGVTISRLSETYYKSRAAFARRLNFEMKERN